ncbi:MAG: hypothetical protein IPJ65_35175 [Archangiaceae bacterium]|nr:hypothetical protein [Archangiaceae bacterium]
MLFPLLATVILDPTTALIGGAAIAVFSTRLIQKSPELELKRTAILGALWGLWYGLTVGWMYFNYTDWMLAYLVDAQKLSVPLTYVVFVAVLVLHGFLAALGVGALVLARRLGVAIAVLVAFIVVNFLIMALQGHAYTHVGTFAEYAANTAKEMSNEPRAQLGMTVAGILAALGGVPALVVRFLAGRKVGAAGATPSTARATA